MKSESIYSKTQLLHLAKTNNHLRAVRISFGLYEASRARHQLLLMMSECNAQSVIESLSRDDGVIISQLPATTKRH